MCRILRARSVPESGGVDLAVEDNGPGIGPHERPRVLERFHRLPGTTGEGAGLGLAIVASIARAHGSEVIIKDGMGGSGIRIRLRFASGSGLISPTG